MSAPERDVAPAHPGADFDVTDDDLHVADNPRLARLFLVTDGAALAEADTIDVPIVGEVDEGGVVLWAGGGR